MVKSNAEKNLKQEQKTIQKMKNRRSDSVRTTSGSIRRRCLNRRRHFFGRTNPTEVESAEETSSEEGSSEESSSAEDASEESTEEFLNKR